MATRERNLDSKLNRAFRRKLRRRRRGEDERTRHSTAARSHGVFGIALRALRIIQDGQARMVLGLIDFGLVDLGLAGGVPIAQRIDRAVARARERSWPAVDTSSTTSTNQKIHQDRCIPKSIVIISVHCEPLVSGEDCNPRAWRSSMAKCRSDPAGQLLVCRVGSSGMAACSGE